MTKKSVRFVIRHSSFVIRHFVIRLSSFCHFVISSFVIRHSSFVIRHSSFVIRHSSFVIRHSSFVIRHSSFVIRHSSRYVRGMIQERSPTLATLLLLALLTAAPAQNAPALPALVNLKQGEPRAHHKLKLPPKHSVGPTIPGLAQGATPQGLAYWEHDQQKWFLISCYFHQEGHPSVVVALDAGTGKMLRCLTLVEPGGKAHTKHVGGLAVSDKY